jgi:hypothetical protein
MQELSCLETIFDQDFRTVAYGEANAIAQVVKSSKTEDRRSIASHRPLFLAVVQQALVVSPISIKQSRCPSFARKPSKSPPI